MTGEELTPHVLRLGYSEGLFPMTMDDGDIGWFRPLRRALFPIEGIHVSRSLRRVIRSNRFEISFDTDFEAVIRGCFRPSDNWLSEDFVRAYTLAFYEGWAHCAECRLDGELVGGVYGVNFGGYLAAESMFHRATNASKVALWAMIHRSRDMGITLFDAQVMNPHLASLGAYEISDQRFKHLLKSALEGQAVRGSWALPPGVQLPWVP
ncbi:MAG TPA: leucyl/phenylalanyl-tRNA--protein transferase [Fimbriimonadaceae bacterium]|nr:leucyl/phenylalanyl-tRNA--protein transferase [Fimbriimonadaceae bacterium]HRJ95125.1 leucyl/phenylalanyl-tRNA--protein transferase [Fimbriimonadaceae bacterium]